MLDAASFEAIITSGMFKVAFAQLRKFDRYAKIKEVLFGQYTAMLLIDVTDGDIAMNIYDIVALGANGV